MSPEVTRKFQREIRIKTILNFRSDDLEQFSLAELRSLILEIEDLHETENDIRLPPKRERI